MINTVYGDQNVEWGAVQAGGHGQRHAGGGAARRHGMPPPELPSPSSPTGRPAMLAYAPSPEVSMAAGRSARRAERRIVRNVRVRTNDERRAAMARQVAVHGGLPRTQSPIRIKRPPRTGRPVSLRAELDRLAAGGEMPCHARRRRRLQSTGDEPPPPKPPAPAAAPKRKTRTLADYSKFSRQVDRFKRTMGGRAQPAVAPLAGVSNADLRAAVARAIRERGQTPETSRDAQRRTPAEVGTAAEDEPYVDPRLELDGEPDPYYGVLVHQEMCHPFPLEQCPHCFGRRCPIEPDAWVAMSNQLDELQDLPTSKQVRFRAYRVVHHVLSSDPFTYHKHLTQDGTPWSRLKLPPCLKGCVRATFPNAVASPRGSDGFDSF